ncbi:MAG: 6-phosphofructokinase [bacterium]|nr:6-phosphofructokinase [bacterium]
MKNKTQKRIGLLTSGGDSSGMNACIRAVVRTAVFQGHRIYGIYKGYQGLLDNLIKEMSPRNVGGIINTGGTILQTSRCKEFFTASGRKRAFENMKQHGINALIVIGGDGSFHGLHKMIKEFRIQGIGLPGTIDNDLYGTDFTIGFDTAINTAMEAIDKIRDTATSHSRLFIVEVMGRDSGYLAQYCGIAGGAEDILIPEKKDDIRKIAQKLEAGFHKGKKSSILVVSEGDETGNAFEIKEQIRKLVDWEIRVSILGHIQRGGSPSAVDRFLATRMGFESVIAVNEGRTDKMVGIVNNQIKLTPLEQTWTRKKKIDLAFYKMIDALSI